MHSLWTIYRPHYQRILAEAAASEGAQFVFDAKITNADSETGTVNLSDGRRLQAHLIVGADGLLSLTKAFPKLSICRYMVQNSIQHTRMPRR